VVKPQAVEREAQNAAVVVGCHGVPAPRLLARTGQDGLAGVGHMMLPLAAARPAEGGSALCAGAGGL
jgi:hypothetical protein